MFVLPTACSSNHFNKKSMEMEVKPTYQKSIFGLYVQNLQPFIVLKVKVGQPIKDSNLVGVHF